MYNAYILKQRSIRATLEMHLFPAKMVQLSMVQIIRSSILHLDEVKGAVSWNSQLELSGVIFGVGTTHG
jgi:hypothetical protein